MKTSILLTSSFLLLTSFGGDFLFQDGASDWKIVLPKDPQRIEAYAAGELQATIKAIGGVELPIVLAEKLPEKHALVIGTCASPFEAVRKVASYMGCCPESADDIVAAMTKAEGDRWTAEMTLPFKDYPKPSAGAYWRLSIIRNTGWRQEPCGFPAAIYRDLNLMAKVYFE